VQNRGRKKNGRRYSPITLQWSYATFQQCPLAGKLFEIAFLFHLAPLLESQFAELGTILFKALIAMGQVGFLIDQWNQSHSQTVNDCRVFVSGGVVSFHSRVTIRSNGAVDGLGDIKQLKSPNLFE
jgi:hypothetical protein